MTAPFMKSAVATSSQSSDNKIQENVISNATKQVAIKTYEPMKSASIETAIDKSDAIKSGRKRKLIRFDKDELVTKKMQTPGILSSNKEKCIFLVFIMIKKSKILHITCIFNI
jgi:hypothetical protein